MMILVLTIKLLFLLGIEGNLSSIGEQNLTEKTKLLKPSETNILPFPIVKALASKGCLIPQPPGMTRSANAIKGSFKAQGQEDWAVVCLRGKRSSILVFWSGSVNSISEISHRVEEGIEDGADCWRDIRTVGKKYIVEHYEAYKDSGAPKPPIITHQGIDEGICDKASIVWYWHRGKWLKLQGAD